jgi:hypothetical protein
MVERYNRTLKQQLSQFVEEQQNWDVQLPSLLMAYRTANHNSTKLTPAKLMLGHELRVPVDRKTRAINVCVSVTDFVRKVEGDLSRVNKFAKRTLI